MLSQKQWKTQQLAERMHNTATSAAIIAADLTAGRKPMVREHGVIADETRAVSVKMMKALEQNIFACLADGKFEALMIGLSRQTALLALNAALVSGKIREQKALAVVADELRNLALELGELYGQSQAYRDIPVVSPRSKVLSNTFDLFHATSGQVTWYENAQFVQEVLNYCPEYIQNGRLVIDNAWRELNAPLIQFGDAPEDAGIVIISDAYEPRKQYAVVAGFEMLCLSRSHVGVSKPCSMDIPVRDCWAASDGSELIFPDWNKISL